MKIHPRFLLSCVLLLGWGATFIPAQEAALPTNDSAPAKIDTGSPVIEGSGTSLDKPAQPTVITSDQLDLDMAHHKGKFTGNVLVVGSDFKMTSEDMDVTFMPPDNKVERIIAHGHVEITQPDRITHAGIADYYLPESKIILTVEPEVIDKGNTVRGRKITIYRDTNRMEVDGGTKVILHDNLNSVPASKPAADTGGAK